MIDHALTRQLLDDLGPAGLQAVAKAFITDLDQLLATLAEAAGAGDTARYARAAHALAGAATTLGAHALEQACRAAPSDAATSDRLPLDRSLAQIRDRARQARFDLRAMLAALHLPD